ncbi:hypothetical protein AVEN_50516-1 [Araneus ventricosus]|uniref:Uncharacterized protein n=1 Tax=Araneus ventricosus TaxID=182803 RepID=A0A4Y2AR01_ARAVE|nr:hypothetical protein AVEN_50516-1 [Araneus ventricosus]
MIELVPLLFLDIILFSYMSYFKAPFKVEPGAILRPFIYATGSKIPAFHERLQLRHYSGISSSDDFTGVWYTKLSSSPQRKKNILEDLEEEATCPLRPIHLFGKQYPGSSSQS